MSEKSMVFEFRKWTGRAGANPRVEVRCRAAVQDEPASPLVVSAPGNAKPHDWRTVTADELANAPTEVQ